MFLRDMPGFAFYFCTYERLKIQLGVVENCKLTTSEKNFAIALSGAVAGTFTWVLCYPCDTLKIKL